MFGTSLSLSRHNNHRHLGGLLAEIEFSTPFQYTLSIGHTVRRSSLAMFLCMVSGKAI